MIDEHGVNLEPNDPKGANFFQAAGGRWAASLGSNLRTNFGVSSPNAIPIASDCESGDIAILEDYNSGRGIKIYRANGQTVSLPNVIVEFASDRTSLKNGLISWVESGSGPRIYDYLNGVEVPFVRLDADWVIGCRTAAGIVILERTAAGSPRLRLAASSLGHEIHEPAYTLDIRPIGSTVKIAWGRTQGEEPGTVGSDVLNPDDLPHTPGNPTTGPAVLVVRDGTASPAPVELANSVREALGGEKFSLVLLIASVALAVWLVNRG